MIVYNLICKNGHEFEAWFRDSAAYDAQAEKGRVICPDCNSRRVSKAMMSPAVAKSKGLVETPRAAPMPVPAAGDSHASSGDPRLGALLAQVRAHVEKNYDYVGDRFAEEARRIHYGEATERPVYGEASPEEVKDLTEEGVPVSPLPPLPRRNS